MGLALCMIVRNEADIIAETVKSAAPVVDEIVIVDTGSTDATLNIARSLGAKVFQTEWKSDFASARNFALSHVTADWVLSLDADEKISTSDHGRILELVKDESVDVYLLVQRHYLAGPGYDNLKVLTGDYPEMEKGHDGFADNRAQRLFRRRGDIVWDGRVHENLVCNDPKARFNQVPAGVVVHHFGKNISQDKADAKKQAYLQLSRIKAQERPDDAKAQFELGVQLHELGRWDDCIPPFKRAYELDKVYPAALYYIGNSHHKMGRFPEAREYLQKLAEVDPSHADGLASLAAVEAAGGQNQAALECYDRAIAANPGGFNAWFNRGALLLKLGEYTKASESLRGALRLMPGYLPAVYGLWQSEIFCGNFEEAASLAISNNDGRLKEMLLQSARRFIGGGKFEMFRNAFDPIAEALNDAALYAGLGASQLAAGQMDDAERSLAKALEMDAGLNDARVNLGQIKELHRRDIEGARKLYEEAFRRDPANEFLAKKLAGPR
ncbi:MAG: tetratricopeptide repeat protein [Nitrospinae bacterium]|nr:tetratricopeptide repeat protein [Nitrospinota bacterium]